MEPVLKISCGMCNRFIEKSKYNDHTCKNADLTNEIYSKMSNKINNLKLKRKIKTNAEEKYRKQKKQQKIREKSEQLSIILERKLKKESERKFKKESQQELKRESDKKNKQGVKSNDNPNKSKQILTINFEHEFKGNIVVTSFKEDLLNILDPDLLNLYYNRRKTISSPEAPQGEYPIKSPTNSIKDEIYLKKHKKNLSLICLYI